MGLRQGRLNSWNIFHLLIQTQAHTRAHTPASLSLYFGHWRWRKRSGVWPNGCWQLSFKKTHFKMLSLWKEGLCVCVCVSGGPQSLNICKHRVRGCVESDLFFNSLCLGLITRDHLIHRVPVPALHPDKWVCSAFDSFPFTLNYLLYPATTFT